MRKLIIFGIIIFILVIAWELYEKYDKWRVMNQKADFNIVQIANEVQYTEMFNYLKEIYNEISVRITENKLIINIIYNERNLDYIFELNNSILSSESVFEPLTNQVYMMVYDAIGSLHELNSGATFATYEICEMYDYDLIYQGIELHRSHTINIKIDINHKPPVLKETSFDSYLDYIGETIDSINNSRKQIAETNINTFAKTINNACLEYYLINNKYPLSYDELGEIILQGEKPIDCVIEITNCEVKLIECKFLSYSKEKICNYINNQAKCQ